MAKSNQKEKGKSLEKQSTDKKNFQDGNFSAEEIIPNEILDAIPEEDRGRVAGIIRQTMISGVMKRSNPIADKITTEHITELISKSDQRDQRDRKERVTDKYYNIALILIALIFIGFLIVFLQSNEDLLIKVVIGIVSFIGGFGFGKTKTSKQDE